MPLFMFLVNKSIATVEIFLNKRVLELGDSLVQLPLKVLFFSGNHCSVFLLKYSRENKERRGEDLIFLVICVDRSFLIEVPCQRIKFIITSTPASAPR